LDPKFSAAFRVRHAERIFLRRRRHKKIGGGGATSVVQASNLNHLDKSPFFFKLQMF